MDALRVPALQQPSNEQAAADCVPYALWMVSSYTANEYPNRSIRRKTNAVTIDDIKEHIKTDELGWRPNQDDLTEVGAEVSSLRFSLEYWDGADAPKSLSEMVSEGLAEDLPTIAFIDALLLRQGKREEGPLHAVVVTGVDDSRAVINDPWLNGSEVVEKDKLEDAWDPDYKQTIRVHLSNIATEDDK